MKKIILFLIISVPAFAQNVDYNKIILPEYTKSPDFAEKLVQLAWKNHPGNEMVKREAEAAEQAVKVSGAQWLNIFSVRGNLNEFTLNQTMTNNEYYYGRSTMFPRYNFGATLNIGELITIPANTKISKEKAKIAQANVNNQKLVVRNSVMKAYNEYVLREKIYKVQSQLLMDNETSHKLIEQRFKNGETNFETYSLSLNNYSTVTVGHLESERNYKNAKLDLEQLIGMRLEDVR